MESFSGYERRTPYKNRKIIFPPSLPMDWYRSCIKYWFECYYVIKIKGLTNLLLI